MTKSKKFSKAIAAVLTVVLAIALAVPALAASCGISGCGRPVYSVQQGTFTVPSSHTFGGFLGIGAQTCDITNHYKSYANKCSAGHTLNLYNTFSHAVHSKTCS